MSSYEQTISKYNRFRKYWASWIVLRMLCTFAKQSKCFQHRGKKEKHIYWKTFLWQQNHWIKWLSNKGVYLTINSSHVHCEAKIYMKQLPSGVWAFDERNVLSEIENPKCFAVELLSIAQAWWLWKGLQKKMKNWNKCQSSNESAE